MSRTNRGSFIALAFLVALPFCACEDSGKIKKIKLRAAAAPAEDNAGQPGGAPLKISIAAMLSPKSSYETYGELARYLGERLALPVKVIFTKKYVETNEALRTADSDIAFMCTGAYLTAKEEFPLDVLAVPVVNGGTVYNSVILTGKAGRARGLGDLKGKIFAFTDEFSLSGHLYVKARLAELKQTSGFFGATLFTGSHDNSIKAVAEGIADAACVDDLIFQSLLQRNDFYAKQLKIIEKSPPFGILPIVARHGLETDIKARARAALLSMHKDKEGARILKTIAIERFVAPEPGLYSYAVEVLRKANKPVRAGQIR